MTIRDLIEQFAGRFTRADQRLIQVLLATPAEGAFLSSVDVAERAGVHPTTAGRLAKKLGFATYRDLRAKLREEFVPRSGARRVQERLAKMGDGSILESLIASEIAALQSVPEQIRQEQMEAAADQIIRARTIAVFGVGHATALADLMARRLRRSGYVASAFHHVGWEAPEEVMSMAPGGVLIGFALRNVPDGLPTLLEFARGAEAASIVVSDLVGPLLRPRPDVLLSSSRGAHGESQSLTVPMAICNALILEISRRDDGRSIDTLERLSEVRRAFERSPPPRPGVRATAPGTLESRDPTRVTTPGNEP